MARFIPNGAARPRTLCGWPEHGTPRLRSAWRLSFPRPGSVPQITFPSRGLPGGLERRDDAREHRLHVDPGERAVRALERPADLSPGAVALGGGRSVEPDTRDSEGGGQMKRPGVAPDADRRAPEQRDELLDGARRSEQRPAVARRVYDRHRGIVLPGAPHDEHPRAGLRGEACAEGG